VPFHKAPAAFHRLAALRGCALRARDAALRRSRRQPCARLGRSPGGLSVGIGGRTPGSSACFRGRGSRCAELACHELHTPF